MTIDHPKFGLVLAGGGAKGAYQAGAIEYLSKELQFVPDIIAGTSIGALNGAILASHQPFEQGVQRLLKLWDQLGQEQILRWNRQTILQTAISVAQTFAPNLGELPSNFQTGIELPSDSFTIFDPFPIENFLKQAVDLAGLRCGIELWVTIFPSLTIPGLKYDWRMALIDFVRGRLGTKAEWRCVWEITNNDALYNLLLASAAIPVAFPRRIVDGQSWVDGGLGDNVPLGALAARECTHAIVIHLENGSVWNRHNFPEIEVIEIRPEKNIDNSNTAIIGGIKAILDFRSKRILELKQQGYEDAQRCLKPIIETLIAVRQQRSANELMFTSTKQLLDDEPLIY